MKYRESQEDKTIRRWFQNDHSISLLRRIRLINGELRGITSLNIEFDFPITAIAGRNGAGKSTILAMACCAYHNRKEGYKPAKRKNSYYTFSDFFIQHPEEIPPQGIDISYTFATNRLRKTEENPSGEGLGIQRRTKKKGGRWNDYDSRLRKNVIFLGIERIVPHYERSQSRSYSKAFKDQQTQGWEDTVKDTVSYILGKKYDNFRLLKYSKYNLPIVKIGDMVYSGFNMGAGENALFEIFSAIYTCGAGALLVMDEIELGLHSDAQKRLIEKLKEACVKTKTLVICTTHSRDIFDCLPSDARFFIENINGKTKLTKGISSDFAFAKLSSNPSNEIDIFVEDDVAKTILLSVLPLGIRTRINIEMIGSASAVSRQMAALFLRKQQKPTIAIFDGDQAKKERDNIGHAQNMLETKNNSFEEWFKGRISYIPGATWPESWLCSKALEYLNEISQRMRCDEEELSRIIEYGLQAGKHNEFHEIAKQTGLEKLLCIQHFSSVIGEREPNLFEHIENAINNLFEEN